MKTWLYIVFGILAGLVTSTLLAVPFNAWYTKNYVGGDDDFNVLVSMLFFGFWPVGALTGALTSHRVQKKINASHATKNRAATSPRNPE